MNKKKLTNKQKKLYGTLLAVAVLLILALIKGKDLKQIFNAPFPDKISAEQTSEPTKSPLAQVEEDGIYSTPDLVAAYIHTFNKLPSNFITKKEAEQLGWVSSEGNLWDVTDEMSIGGDKFGNYEGLLPKADGRQWYECDVNYYGGYRGSERIVYSNDGLIYYTHDHYESFTQLY